MLWLPGRALVALGVAVAVAAMVASEALVEVVASEALAAMELLGEACKVEDWLALLV